jgi:1-acyl-sn-glycerol-3-phosphate acyltransferase
MRPEPGAGFLALHAGAPILPVAVAGSQDVLRAGSRLPRRAPVRLTFGGPFTLAVERPDGARTGYQEAADAVMLAVAELLPPELRGEFADLDGWRDRVGWLVHPTAVGDQDGEHPSAVTPPVRTGGQR